MFSDPIVINRRLMKLSNKEMAGAAVGDRFGAAAVLEVLGGIDPAKVQGDVDRCVCGAAAHWGARLAARSYQDAGGRNDLRGKIASRRAYPADGRLASRAAAGTGERRTGRRGKNRRRADGV